MNTPKLIDRFAERFNVDPSKLLETLKATAFKQRDGTIPTNEQMMALLVVANQYGLNPFTKEIFAFPDKQAGIIPVVGVDGWSRILNQHDQFDGMEFAISENIVTYEHAKPCPDWMECILYRKDRKHAVKVTEYLDEVYRAPFEGNGKNGNYRLNSPWQTHTKRMLRHKSMIQCARVAFGFVGIYDHDEAERIIEADTTTIDHGSAPPIALTQKAQTLTNKLIKRAITTNAWQSAYEYAAEHFQGNELLIIQSQLAQAREAQATTIDPSDVNTQPAMEEEEPTTIVDSASI